jgi:PAS domain S-box-containing protein
MRTENSRSGRPQVEIPFANSPDRAVIATDPDGTVFFWNSAAEQLYGWKWDEAVGRLITELIVPEREQPDAMEIMQRLRRGESWTGKIRLRHRDGTEFTATVTDQPIRDQAGNLIGIIGISDPSDENRG